MPLTDAEKEMEGKIEWIDDPFDAATAPAPLAPPPPPPVVEGPKFETAVIVKKPVPANTLVNKDTAAEYFTIAKVEKTPDGVAPTTADLYGKFIIKPLTEGSYVFKSVTADKALEIVKPEPPVVVEKKPEPKPEPKPEEKVYARFTTTIVTNGQFRKVVWLEVAPDQWKDFESDEAANKYIKDQSASKKPDAPKAGK
jgi:hypothetical protein